MRIINLNPDTAIGASAWFVSMDGNQILLDAGVHPKRAGNESLPLYDLIKEEEVDAIAISHCHHDHVGSLPVALRHFPKAHVLMSELSYFIVERVLHNSVNVMIRQKDEIGIPEYPLYRHAEVDEIAPQFQGFRYNQEINWAAFHKARHGFPSPTLEFLDAGHALGSAGIMLRGKDQTLFYSGDVCFQDQTILKGSRFEDVKADVLIMETTRGNREVAPDASRDKEVQHLIQSIQEVLARKGSVLIPTFALGRAQEILAILALAMGSGQLKSQPIYIGGLSRVFTEIYDLQAHRAHRHHSQLRLNEALNLIVMDPGQAQKIRLTGGRLFVITAGMMTENTAAHDLAVRMIGEERHGIFFVGYADPDSPGGRLKAAKQGETFLFSSSGGEVTKKCDMRDFDLTAHANRDELLNLVTQVDPKTVILGHGEMESKLWFASQIQKRHPKIKVLPLEPGESVEV